MNDRRPGTRSLPDWLFTDLEGALENAFGVPATVDNECNLAALGEQSFGVAEGLQHVVYLKVVVGTGAGVIVNGQLVRGAGGMAGEISHLHVDRQGPMCACGARGCLGAIATTQQILDAARPVYGPTVDIYDVLGLAVQDEPSVRRVLDDVGRLLGQHLAPAVLMLNPETIVVDGTLGPAALPVIDGLSDGLARHLPAGVFRSLRLSVGRLGDSAELLRAARAATQETNWSCSLRKRGHLSSYI